MTGEWEVTFHCSHLVLLGFLYHGSGLSIQEHSPTFKKSPNLNRKLQSELLIILFIQRVSLFHYLPKNRLGATS